MEDLTGSFTLSALNIFEMDKESKLTIKDSSKKDNQSFKNTSFNEILCEYKKVIFNSLLTAFSLDALIFNDINGADVQTTHNGENGVYANSDFKEKGERKYDRDNYATANYMHNRRKKEFQANEHIHDCYTGKELNKDGRTHLEHIVSAKENHDRTDMRLFFTKEEMSEIINSDKNTAYTDGSLNQSKSDKTFNNWENQQSKKDKSKTNGEYYDVDSERANKVDYEARKSIDEKVIKRKLSHYSKSIGKDSLVQGGKLALRQGLGIVFTEVTMTVLDEVPSITNELKGNFSVEKFFSRISELVKKAFERVKDKLGNILEAIQTGFISGVFNSIVTTIINMFLTTAKNIIRLIRQAMVSITEAIKILFFDKKKRSKEERILAASKIILTGASTVLGIILEQSMSTALKSSGISAIPLIGDVLVDVIPIFAGTLLSGLLSITFLYFMDNSDKIKKLISFISKLTEDCFDKSLETIKYANELLDKYIADLCNVDVYSLKLQVKSLHEVNLAIENNNTEKLYEYCNLNNIKLQFNNTEEFIDLMLSTDTLEI